MLHVCFLTYLAVFPGRLTLTPTLPAGFLVYCFFICQYGVSSEQAETACVVSLLAIFHQENGEHEVRFLL